MRQQAFHMDDETPASRALAAALISETDLLRLKAVARLHAYGLPGDVDWHDLLQEAILRTLEGKRRPPDGISMVTFLAGVMRSIKSEHWRRLRREARDFTSRRTDGEEAVHGVCDPSPDQERRLVALTQLRAIDRLFVDDRQALQILGGLGEGLSAEEIQKACGMSRTEYESTRKRMRRLLLREGLAWRPQ